MKILISPERIIENEYEKVETFINEKVFDIFHLRKPNYSLDEMRNYLSHLSPEVLQCTVIHSHYELALEFPVKGIHLTFRTSIHHSELSQTYNVVSMSCHSFVEVEENEHFEFEYLFLSPIFESISKDGYSGDFKKEELITFLSKRKKPVIALGGVSDEKIKECHEMGFGGVAMLGAVWQ